MQHEDGDVDWRAMDIDGDNNAIVYVQFYTLYVILYNGYMYLAIIVNRGLYS